jgi:hypothetical protein
MSITENLMRTPYVATAFCLAISTASCSHVPLTSIPRLSRIDIVTTDLRVLRAAMELPADVRVPPSAVTLAVAWRPATGEKRGRKFALVEAASASDRADLPPPAAGARFTVYRLLEEDTLALEAFRREMIEERARSGRGQGSLGIGASKICRTGEAHERPIPASASLKTAETGGYVAVLRVADMRKALKDEGVDLSGPLPPCP